MVTVIFKILLIILIPAPVIAFAAYFYAQMLGFISERNKAEKKHLKEGSLKVSRGSADKSEKPKKAGRTDETDKKSQGRKTKSRSSKAK